MRYLVQVNWIGQFAKAFLWSVLSLATLAYGLSERGAFVIGLGFAVGFGYLAIGAAINGWRAFAATFRVRYGWGRDK